jgi:apolipoprotein D and lipocalin family protein
MIPENRRYSNFRKEAKLKKWITIFGLAIVVFSWAGAAKSDSPLTVVDVVDLNRYLGMWYEIASYPSWFQKGCTASTAEYSLLPNGKIRVVNRCHKDSLEGPLKVSKGKAEVVDTTTNAKLKVWFF